jgi:hypothetical protein
MEQNPSEDNLKRMLGLTILGLIKLWEAFEEKESSFETLTETHKSLEKAARSVRKYKKHSYPPLPEESLDKTIESASLERDPVLTGPLH